MNHDIVYFNIFQSTEDSRPPPKKICLQNYFIKLIKIKLKIIYKLLEIR
jgi:hypothetical protein